MWVKMAKFSRQEIFLYPNVKQFTEDGPFSIKCENDLNRHFEYVLVIPDSFAGRSKYLYLHLSFIRRHLSSIIMFIQIQSIHAHTPTKRIAYSKRNETRKKFNQPCQ